MKHIKYNLLKCDDTFAKTFVEECTINAVMLFNFCYKKLNKKVIEIFSFLKIELFEITL